MKSGDAESQLRERGAQTLLVEASESRTRTRELLSDEGDGVWRRCARGAVLAVDIGEKADAVDQLHGEEPLALLAIELAQAGKVRVAKIRQQPKLLLEAKRSEERR